MPKPDFTFCKVRSRSPSSEQEIDLGRVSGISPQVGQEDESRTKQDAHVRKERKKKISAFSLLFLASREKKGENVRDNELGWRKNARMMGDKKTAADSTDKR